MRCVLVLLLLAFPVTATAADTAPDQSPIIALLTNEVQQLRAENEKLSARLYSIEAKLSAQPKLGFVEHVDDPVGVRQGQPNSSQVGQK